MAGPPRFDLTTEEGKRAALEYEKTVFRTKRDAREAVEREPRTRPPTLIGHSLEELLRHKFPPRRTLLARGMDTWIREGNLWQIFAYRGTGKTWFLETIALITAYMIEVLGLRAPEPSRVLYVDGEMTGLEVQERFQKLADILKVPRQLGLLNPNEQRLIIVGADWQDQYLPRLDTPEGQAAIEPFVEPADLILLDGRPSLFDREGEKDPVAWTPAQEWLLSLRKRGKAVVWAHQANRQGGSRGLGAPEDVIDVNLKLSRPSDYVKSEGARFLVEFDKARGIFGASASTFEATLDPWEGWSTVDPDAISEEETRDAEEKLDLIVLKTLMRCEVADKKKLALLLRRAEKDIRESLNRLMGGETPLVEQEKRRKPLAVTVEGKKRLQAEGELS